MILSIARREKGHTLSENFIAGEFACRCGKCEQILVDEMLVQRLQRLRDRFGKPIHITSGYRCLAHNKASGGSVKSLHMEGRAADVVIEGVEPLQVARAAEEMGVPGIGLYDDFVHIDTRAQKAFWYGYGQQSRSTFLPVEDPVFSISLRLLRRNCQGEDVRSLQAYLTGSGFAVDPDGVFGMRTENAVRQYQRSCGMTADGIVGIETRKRMLGI